MKHFATLIFLLMVFFPSNYALAIGDHTPDYTQKVWMGNIDQEVRLVTYDQIPKLEKQGWKRLTKLATKSKPEQACEKPNKPVLVSKGNKITDRPNFCHHTMTNTYAVCDGEKWWYELGPSEPMISYYIIAALLAFMILLILLCFSKDKDVFGVWLTLILSCFVLFCCSTIIARFIFTLPTLVFIVVAFFAYFLQKQKIGWWISWSVLLLQAILILLHGWAWPM